MFGFDCVEGQGFRWFAECVLGKQFRARVFAHNNNDYRPYYILSGRKYMEKLSPNKSLANIKKNYYALAK